MNDKFLKYYFEKELYVKNPPMNMDKFIKFCKQRGIGIDKSKLDELEFKEKFYPIFRSTAIYYWGEYCCPSFNYPQDKEIAIEYLNDGKIYLPKNKEFRKFKDFKDKTKDLKTCSFYSAFQIYSLVEILNEEKTVKVNFNFNHENFVNLLIAIQLYSPYGKSNLKTIPNNKLKEFNLDEALKIINIEHDSLYQAYVTVCKELKNLLGSYDIIQLWKNIEWSKKNECVGHTRLGIEYLQWAMMLKKCIEDYCGHEILDVDETNGDWEKVRDTLPQNETGHTLRGMRNKWYTNKLTGEYEFANRRKLYYLCNSLGLDYHPKIVLLVEGKIEKIIITKFFKEILGYNIKDLGIEIVNLDGINNATNISLLTNFIFNLYQCIPFLIIDNENSVPEKMKDIKIFDKKQLLENIGCKNINNINLRLPDKWMYIWNSCFEFGIYSDEELAKAINAVCKKKVYIEQIKDCRNNKNSVNKLLNNNSNKVEINNKAFEYLANNYYKTKNFEIFKDRSIYELIEKIFEIPTIPPWNTKHESDITKILSLCILTGIDIIGNYEKCSEIITRMKSEKDKYGEKYCEELINNLKKIDL